MKLVPGITAALLVLRVATSAEGLPGVPGEDPEIDYAARWAEATSFASFLEGVARREDEWRQLYAASAEIGAGKLPGRVLAAGGHWRLLVIAEDWCGDSVNTIPWLARLAERTSNLELAMVSRSAGEDVMRAHRTPDGRAATPTVVILDESFGEQGCWIERPEVLQTWFLEREGRVPRDELFARKYEWYASDRGSETLREVVERIEAAASGSPLCPARPRDH